MEKNKWAGIFLAILEQILSEKNLQLLHKIMALQNDPSNKYENFYNNYRMELVNHWKNAQAAVAEYVFRLRDELT
jgi:hypothetical protein